MDQLTARTHGIAKNEKAPRMGSYDIMKLGSFRNSPRFYKQGKRLLLAGFAPGKRFKATVEEARGMVVLRVDTAGDRLVSAKGADVPVIDINSAEVLGMFEGMDRIRVVVRAGEICLLALATEVRRAERIERLSRKLEAGEPLRVGSVSHGAGILSHALHAGLAAAGVASELVFANDIEPVYLAQAEAYNDAWTASTAAVSAPLQEFAFDDWAMRQLGGTIDILEGGIPCTAASLAGRAKKGHAQPEDDPDVGHLIVGFLTLIARLNPALVLLENVPSYQNTASMALFRTQMRDLGYEVHERVLEAAEFGALENRKRLAAVAVTKGMVFDFGALVAEKRRALTIGDILDPVPLDAPAWSTMSYLKVKEQRDQEKKATGRPGTWFARQEVTAADIAVPTITKGYNKRRSTDPMLVHPENPELLRLFTPAEHARIKGVPERLIEGMCASRAHEVLGQGICYAPFHAVGRHIGATLRRQTTQPVDLKYAA